ncbi:ribulose bisphosphate carboxylase small subunit, partial [Acinetobacter baumannii]|uniref:ribulose bisphosphate carboxylase small subunit n=1 Tax=Acinetobacter baumannii TaxID=470 RepID=UPI001BC8797A
MGSTAAMAAATSKMSTSTTIAALNLATPFSGGSFRSSAKTAKRSPGLRVQCMKVWNPYNNKKWETLSYLPPLSLEQILKQVDYLLLNKWVPCLEFDEDGYIKREGHKSPGYYDGRYWTMWKLPMFGCNDSTQVMQEIQEASKEYPKAFVRVIGFDAVRQVQ